ncbi:MAG TPA: DUF4476 domain-containing protein [Chitinophagaceae bacterium]|nr:DUF4476 domain-containing protein [Chitinophagaceae bacterium]
MNKMYTMIAALLLSIVSFAAERPKSGRLTIATYDNAEIRAEIDGRRYSESDNTVRINNINPGYHSIQVYRRTSSGAFSRNREQLVYSTNLYVKPDHQVDIIIDRSGRASVKEYDLRKKGRNRKNNDWDTRNDNSRWEDYDNWDRNYDGRNDGRWNDRPDRNYEAGRAVSYDMFQTMKQTLRRESFENTRLTLAKQMIDRNGFESAQVKEMLQLFSFESNRLELAKHAYRNTVDKRNFFVVNDVFSFNSSKDELARYISNVR